MHPCGRYHKNSITQILEKEYGMSSDTIFRTSRFQFALAVHCTSASYTRTSRITSSAIYRLDRLTSGVLLVARSAKKAKHMSEYLHRRTADKIYITRVKGQFKLQYVVSPSLFMHALF